jgi:hypothetical protein
LQPETSPAVRSRPIAGSATGGSGRTPAARSSPRTTEQGTGGQWSLVPSPNPGANGDNGLAGITSIPGGGLWSVGIATNNGNPSTLIEYHP